MKFELYTRVALSCDIPDRNLKQGDVAMLIDTVPDPDTGEGVDAQRPGRWWCGGGLRDAERRGALPNGGQK
jgi:hypothetical protein